MYLTFRIHVDIHPVFCSYHALGTIKIQEEKF